MASSVPRCDFPARYQREALSRTLLFHIYDFHACATRIRVREHDAVVAGENATQIAECLDREGLRPPSRRADRFTPEMARDLVYRLGLSQRRRPNESLAVDE